MAVVERNSLEVELLPKQQEFLNTKKRYGAYIGGVGAGKTYVGCLKTILEAMHSPDTLHLIARRTYPELRDSTRRTFFELLPPAAMQQFHVAENRCVVKCINGGTSEVLFRPLDDVMKLTGINFATAYIDEASEVEEEIWMTVISRLRDPKGSRHAWVTSNPPTTNHWIYKWFVSHEDEEYKLIQASTFENPHLPDDYVKQLQRDYKHNESWLKRYLMGEFGTLIEGSPVYTNFSADRHIADLSYIPGRPVYRGWDFGFNHPAIVWCQIDGRGRMVVIKELMGAQSYLKDFVEQVIRESNEHFPKAKYLDYCDPAGQHRNDATTATSIDILRAKNIHPLFKYGRVMSGVEIINRQLALMIDDQPAILINKSCPTLRDAMNGGYHYAKNKEGELTKEEPHKDGYYEHLVDALRYIVVNLLDAPVQKSWKDIDMSYPSYTFNP